MLTQTMKFRASGGAALRVRTFEAPQHAAAPTTRANAPSGPEVPVVAVALDPMPVRRLYALWRTGAARRPAIAETVRVLGELWPVAAAHPPR